MKKSNKVIEFSDYKKNSISKNKGNNAIDNENKSLFDTDIDILTLNVNRAIRFSNNMPDITIEENVINNSQNQTIQEIIADTYLKDHLKLKPDKYTKEDIKKIAEFIEGIYDLQNIKKNKGCLIYQKNDKERCISLDGYNSIQNLM